MAPAVGPAVTALGYAAASLTTLSFFPQAIKTLRTNETRGISLRMYLLFTVGITGWGIYGYLNRDWPVFVANLVTLPATAAILERKLQAQWALRRQRQHQGK
jgi:MtN3 and saliva related transmembrane protein